jgi:diguanylate cyclase (GGDEF)-like protein
VSNDGEDTKVGAAMRTLALLNAQADAVRTDLANLRREFVKAQQDFNSLRTAQLMEVNEQLVLAAVHADTAAQTAVSSLDELARFSQHDELTGAPNRTLMLDRIVSALAMAQRRGHRVGILFIDLDGFKQINDTLGHSVGDQVLQIAARRMQGAVRESDTVSRHSGDEFLVLLAEMAEPADAAPIAAKILASLGAPARIGPHTLRLSASIGITVYPEDGTEPSALIGRADEAMYRAKKRSKGEYEFYEKETSTTGSARLDAFDPPAQRLARPDFAFAEHEARLRELLKANHQLVGAAQTAQRLKTNAEEAHRRQINFVAMAAHAMRNPLAVIRMSVSALGLPLADEAFRANQHEVIKRQVTHMARLIDDLLDGSRVGAGEFRLECSQVELRSIVALSIDACKHAIDSKQLRLRTEMPGEPTHVHGDPLRLTQVFSNLLNNASRRSVEGGEVSFAMQVDGDEVEISVTDKGVGISEEALPHIFDLFVLDTHVHVDDAGLGIGLAVVAELVKAHGGRVSAASDGPGTGSTFVVRLPRDGRPRDWAAWRAADRVAASGAERAVGHSADAGQASA